MSTNTEKILQVRVRVRVCVLLQEVQVQGVVSTVAINQTCFIRGKCPLLSSCKFSIRFKFSPFGSVPPSCHPGHAPTGGSSSLPHKPQLDTFYCLHHWLQLLPVPMNTRGPLGLKEKLAINHNPVGCVQNHIKLGGFGTVFEESLMIHPFENAHINSCPHPAMSEVWPGELPNFRSPSGRGFRSCDNVLSRILINLPQGRWGGEGWG